MVEGVAGVAPSFRSQMLAQHLPREQEERTNMPLELITPPAVEPVSLDEVKAHLKVDGTDDDALIGALITAARAQAEWHTHRAFVTQDWIYWRDELPDHGVVKIPLAPLQSLSSITLYPRDGTTHVLDAAAYQVDAVGAPPRIARPIADRSD